MYLVVSNTGKLNHHETGNKGIFRDLVEDESMNTLYSSINFLSASNRYSRCAVCDEQFCIVIHISIHNNIKVAMVLFIGCVLLVDDLIICKVMKHERNI